MSMNVIFNRLGVFAVINICITGEKVEGKKRHNKKKLKINQRVFLLLPNKIQKIHFFTSSLTSQ